MKVFVVLSVLISAAVADTCFYTTEKACRTTIKDVEKIENCDAKYGLFKNTGETNIEVQLQAYVNTQIEDSFKYLLMSTLYGNYQKNRDGFKSLYRKLSDKSWDDAIDLIKFITKRGGGMDFTAKNPIRIPSENPPANTNKAPSNLPEASNDSTSLNLNEIQSLAKALDIQKNQAQIALDIHARAGKHAKVEHDDASVAHYLEERFMESQADTIRSLSGHITDLKQFLNEGHSALSLFIFDEYLQKIV